MVGPPGIGKSRLGSEAAAQLAPRATVLTGRCLAYGAGITYWPLREIFAADGGEAELDDALAAEAPEEIFWAVRKALELRACERPLVLVIEDLHWAEPTLLDLLEHVREWTRDAPILLLCLARPELLDERPAWGGQLVVLEALSTTESDELIGYLLRDHALHTALRDRTRELAEGNPLFVEQLLAAFAEGGDPGRVPPTIEALLAARVDALPEEERSLLENASVAGLQFEWQALGHLALDGRRPSGGALSALMRKDLIQSDAVGEDGFRFRHVLIRDAAYRRIPKEHRADLHERFAAWLQGREDDIEEIVAFHLEQAYRCIVALGPETDRSRALAEQAAARLAASGRRAAARGDAAAAAKLLQRATSLLDADDERRLRLLPALGRVLRGAGDIERADSILSEAIELGRETGRQPVVADATVARCDLHFHQARIGRQ